MMLYDIFQEKCNSIIAAYKSCLCKKDKVNAAKLGITLEELKVDYYTGLQENFFHNSKKMKDYVENQLANAYTLLGIARDEYMDLNEK